MMVPKYTYKADAEENRFIDIQIPYPMHFVKRNVHMGYSTVIIICNK